MFKKKLCFIKKNEEKKNHKRQNTPHHRQTVIDIDNGNIEKIKSNYANVDYEYIPNSSVLHIFKK